VLVKARFKVGANAALEVGEVGSMARATFSR